jgi:hypothetical protein
MRRIKGMKVQKGSALEFGSWNLGLGILRKSGLIPYAG